MYLSFIVLQLSSILVLEPMIMNNIIRFELEDFLEVVGLNSKSRTKRTHLVTFRYFNRIKLNQN